MIEPLESRLLPSMSVGEDVIIVRGTRRADEIMVSRGSFPSGQWFRITVNGRQWNLCGTKCQARGVNNVLPERVLVFGGAGDDTISVHAAMGGTLNATLRGGSGNDTITTSADVVAMMLGGGGNDTLQSGKRSETLSGGGGADYLTVDEDDVIRRPDRADIIRLK
jgi:Ca2+-binding RTX toxin-like protein